MRCSQDNGSNSDVALISCAKSLAFIGSASARGDRVGIDAGAEALSITRLEGSRWCAGRLWSYEPGLRTVVRLR
jgi:hypothetical protein